MCKCKKWLKFILIAVGAVMTISGIVAAVINRKKSNDETQKSSKGAAVAVILGILCTVSGGVMWLWEKFGDKLSDAAKLFETKKQWDWTDLMCDFCNLKAQTENRMARLGSGISEFVSNTKSKFIK